MRFTYEQLYEAVKKIGFSGEQGPYLARGRSLFEGVLHEYAHSLLLGGIPEYDIGPAISKLPELKSDWNEIKTLAVEILVAREFGINFSVGTLAEFATENMKSHTFMVPRYRNVESAINRAFEFKDVRQKVKLAKEAILEQLA